jgi:concentrative nucleoside transporter, CNT family
MWAQRGVPLLGYAIIILVIFALSKNRKGVRLRPVLWAAGLQFLLCGIMFLTPIGQPFFKGVNQVVNELLAFTNEGTAFLLGEFSTKKVASPLHCFLFLVLPTIIFFSSLMAVLYHLRIMQYVISGMAWVLRKTLGISGAEAMTAAANVFVGHTEAPLVVRPYVKDMTRSEIMAVMVAGFGTMAGGVIVAYAVMLQDVVDDVAGHLLTASLMNAPASLLLAKILLPETETPVTADGAPFDSKREDANVVGAAARGAAEGASLFINVAAMLLAFIALVALVNAMLSGGLSWVGLELYDAAGKPDAMQQVMGYLFYPIAWLCGVSADGALDVGRLLAQKLVLNEFMAYSDLSDLLQKGSSLSKRDVIIAIYALCGFANVSSIAIQIGGIGGMAGNQKENLVRLGLLAMCAGFLASCLSACVAAVFI